MLTLRRTLPVVISAFFYLVAQAQTVNYYKFKNRYVDLASLKENDALVPGATPHDREALHAVRFDEPAPQRIERPEGVWTIDTSRTITISDRSGKPLRTIADPDRATRLDHIVGNLALFAGGGGVLRLVRLEGRGGYVLRRYAADGGERGTWRVPHTLYTTQGHVTQSTPHLYHFAHTTNEVIFTSGRREQAETVILNLTDGSQRKLPYGLAGIVLRADRSLAGWVRAEGNGQKLLVEIGSTQLAIADEWSGDAVKAVLADNTLYLAHYHNIATGCGLLAYDIRTGKRLWRGDVRQLEVGHSEYFNLVYLSLVAGRLILEAHEAAGDYLQIFDPATGRRLFERMPAAQ